MTKTIAKVAALVIAALTMACAGVEPASSEVEAVPAPVELAQATKLVDAAPEPSCEVVFTPVAPTEVALAALTEEVDFHANRWANATGCDVHTGEGGIPVILVEATDPHLWSPEANKFMGGATVLEASGTTIYVPKRHRPEAVPHELGHAIARRVSHAESPDATMSATGSGQCLSEADVTYACVYINCTVFAPECP